jgi:cytochrome P450
MPPQQNSGAPLKGPRGYPILGVLPMLRANTLRYLEHVAKEYGDFVPMRMFMQTSYLLNHPAHVEHVLQTNYRNYRKTKMMEKFKPILGEGLFISEDELWTRQRRLIQPSFHKQRVDGMASTMLTAISSHVEAWAEHAKRGEAFNLSEDMSALALEIALRTMFGNSFLPGEEKAVSDALIVGNEVTAERVWQLTRISEHLPTAKNRAYNEAVRTLDTVVNRIIGERRSSQARPDDLLSVLIDARDADTNEGMDDKQLRDEVLTLLLSGHETTAIMLGWALLFLVRNPDCLERLRDEVDTVLQGQPPTAADLKKLDYTKRVIHEVARLRPSIWWFARVAVNDDNICGQPIKAGTTVLISQYLVHRNPSIWDDPERFDPDRFLPENVVRRSKFAYLPFGAGPRVCIGSTFAMMEMQFILAMLCRRYDIEIVSALEPELSSMITLRPKEDILAKVRLRRRH